jgi:MFS family permease
MTEQGQDTMQTLPSRRKVRRSLRLSVLDGAAFSAMAGLTQNYITPFALALKATTAQIGLLASVPNFTMALSQLAAPNLSERAGSRKGFILPMVFMHALMWLPILLVPYVFPGPKIWWLIGFITLSGVLSSIANPAWGSMMADLVPEEVRGRYFSFRGRIAGFITLIFSFIGGGVLQLFTGNVFAGFAIIFAGAMLFRLLSLYFLSGMYEPPISLGKGSRQSLLHMVRHLGSSNLGRFTLYVAMINFATNLAGPFFAVYMLRDLKFNYLTYMLIISFNAIANLVSLTFWGRRADLAGNIKVIRVTSFLIPFVPLVWLGSSNVYYLMGAEILSGFAWSGFNLAIVNFVYDASEPENRTKQIALFNSTTLVAACLGALIGGYLAPHLPAVLGYQLRTLFTISGVLRALVVVSLLRLIFEVRHVPKISFVQFLLGRSGSRS